METREAGRGEGRVSRKTLGLLSRIGGYVVLGYLLLIAGAGVFAR